VSPDLAGDGPVLMRFADGESADPTNDSGEQTEITAVTDKKKVQSNRDRYSGMKNAEVFRKP